MRNKETLRANYNEWCGNYISFKEYCEYQVCVSKVRIGDRVKLFLENNSFYSYQRTTRVSGWLDVIGKGDHMILVGSKNQFGSLYSAQDLCPRKDITMAENYRDYFCWYITTAPNIEGRIAELQRAS
jgi:hypothetical protein